MTETERTAEDIGANIVRAARVMRETHREVSSLLGWLDEAFGHCGWSPFHVSSSNWVALAMNGAQIGKPENWMATLVRRGYVPEGEADGPRERALLVEVDLAPERGDLPVIGLLAVTFDEPVARRELWSSWSWSSNGCWRTGCTEGRVELDAATLGRVVSAATGRSRGLVVPLCEVDRRSAHTRVIEPALALFEGWQSMGTSEGSEPPVGR